VLDPNLTAAFACAQRAARLMVESETRRRIVNITSVHEHIPLSGAAAYCAAKGGLGLPTNVVDGGLMLTSAEFNREAAHS
jgi:NAD(P)-dependent dehydrogenase (short-subunit alcohol dehydrogenase family)